MAEEARHPLLDRLRERRERHGRRSMPYRVAFAGAGFAVVAGGVVLSLPFVPGPGLLLVAVGLAMLALEFDWAERLVERIVHRLEPATRISPWLAVVFLTAAVGTAVAVALLWDVPFLPV